MRADFDKLEDNKHKSCHGTQVSCGEGFTRVTSRLSFIPQRGIFFDFSQTVFVGAERYQGEDNELARDFIQKGARDAYLRLGLEEGLFGDPIPGGLMFEIFEILIHPVDFSSRVMERAGYEIVKRWMKFGSFRDSLPDSWNALNYYPVFNALTNRVILQNKFITIRGNLVGSSPNFYVADDLCESSCKIKLDLPETRLLAIGRPTYINQSIEVRGILKVVPHQVPTLTQITSAIMPVQSR